MSQHAPAPAPRQPGPCATDGLVQVQKELTARGFPADEPAPGQAGHCRPAQPERGHARVTDEGGTVLWLCPFTRPGSPAPGLAPADMATTIAAVLAPYQP
jgi:hypothetical protein